MSTIPKVWGEEILLHVSDNYWMKKLKFDPFAGGSLHWHAKKEETWYVEEGSAAVYTFAFGEGEMAKRPSSGWKSDAAREMVTEGLVRVINLKKGDVLHLPPKQVHQVCAGADGVIIIEASTTHEDKDVFRMAPSFKGEQVYE